MGGAAGVYSIVRFALRARGEGSVNLEESIEVDVPIRMAYDQWTQFEEFPRFMEGVKAIRQIDDTHQHWVADVGGIHREWDAGITEQRPEERVAWRGTDGAENSGVVTFHRINDGRTLVTVQLGFRPRGPIEAIGNALGAVRMRSEGTCGGSSRSSSLAERRPVPGARRSRASISALAADGFDGTPAREARLEPLGAQHGLGRDLRPPALLELR